MLSFFFVVKESVVLWDREGAYDEAAVFLSWTDGCDFEAGFSAAFGGLCWWWGG